MSAPRKFTKEKKELFLNKLENSLGIISIACKQVGISRETYYNEIARDTEFAKQCEGVKDLTLDFVESKLLNLIKEGDTAATIFYLKTKGKHRGYVEREPTLNIKNDFSSLTIPKLTDNLTYFETDS